MATPTAGRREDGPIPDSRKPSPIRSFAVLGRPLLRPACGQAGRTISRWLLAGRTTPDGSARDFRKWDGAAWTFGPPAAASQPAVAEARQLPAESDMRGRIAEPKAALNVWTNVLHKQGQRCSQCGVEFQSAKRLNGKQRVFCAECRAKRHVRAGELPPAA